MKKLLIAAALLLASFSAMSQTAPNITLSWTAPTLYEDGTPILAGDIIGYKIYYGTTAGGPYPTVISVPAGILNANISTQTLARGTYYFVATTLTANGLESAYSGEVSKAVAPASKPKPPVLK